jgi:hypothetical protein
MVREDTNHGDEDTNHGDDMNHGDTNRCFGSCRHEPRQCISHQLYLLYDQIGIFKWVV